MSFEYGVHIGIGFTLDVDAVRAAFATGTVEEVSHNETRFDEDTGRPYQIKVIDEYAGIQYRVDDTILKVSEDQADFDDTEFVEALQGLLKCTVNTVGEYDSPREYSFSIDAPDNEDGIGINHLDIGPSYNFDPKKWTKKLETLRKRMIKHGLKPGKATIHPSWGCGY